VEVLRSGGSPHSIALGFAIGSFIAIMPTPGFNLLLGLLIAVVFRKVNRISLFAAIFFWNPLFTASLIPPSLKIGGFLFSNTPSVDVDITLFSRIFHFTQKFLVGISILALLLSVASYAAIRLLAEAYVRKLKHGHPHRLAPPRDEPPDQKVGS